MTNNNVQNFPVVDKRVVDFVENLGDWVYANGQDLPVMAIVGALETVKFLVLEDSLNGDA